MPTDSQGAPPEKQANSGRDVEPSAPPQVLIVDDDLAILKLIQTVLSSKGIVPTAAANLAEATAALQSNPDFAVILCDHLLPDGLGVEFLRDLRSQRPGLVRVLMTSLYDKALAMNAINAGEIYRFLTKPFTVEDLLSTVSQGFDRYSLGAENARLQSRLALQNEELRRANAELSGRAAAAVAEGHKAKADSANWQLASRGMIDLCLEILERIDPVLFNHSRRASILAGAIARELRCDAEMVQRAEIAAQLHDIALLGCNPALLAAQRHPEQITDPVEREQIEQHAHHSAQLVKFLPLPDVLEAIEDHHEHLDGTGYPNRKGGVRLSRLSQIVAVADAYDEMAATRSENVLPRLLQEAGRLYDAEVVHAAERAVSQGLALPRERQVLLHELIPGMRLSGSIYTATGMLLVKQGQVLNKPMIDRLLQHAESNAIIQKILVEH
jgi:response regulator RpfG family c-di-GMP phosphodiesterase